VAVPRTSSAGQLFYIAFLRGRSEPEVRPYATSPTLRRRPRVVCVTSAGTTCQLRFFRTAAARPIRACDTRLRLVYRILLTRTNFSAHVKRDLILPLLAFSPRSLLRPAPRSR